MTELRQWQTQCHYCHTLPGNTRDHIVPWSIIRKVQEGVSQSERPVNTVKACAPCNRNKADMRATCECIVCVAAWEFWLPRLDGFEPKVIDPTVGRGGFSRINGKRVWF